MHKDAKRTEKRYPPAGIGYPIGFDEVALEVLDLLDEKGKKVSVGNGHYVQYKDPSGAELWRYFYENGEGEGSVEPYFEGIRIHPAFLNMVVKNPDYGFEGVGASVGQPGISRMEEVEVFMAVVFPTGRAYQNLRDTTVNLKVTAIPQTGVKLLDFSYTEKMWAQMKESGRIPFLASSFVADDTGRFPVFRGENQLFTLIKKVEKKINASNGREFLHIIGEVDQGHLLDIVVETIFFPGELLPGRSLFGTFTLHGMIVDDQGNRLPGTGNGSVQND